MGHGDYLFVVMQSPWSRARLDPEQAFVVQLTATTAMGRRMKHITSGQCLRFGSVTELVAFMQQSFAAGRSVQEEGAGHEVGGQYLSDGRFIKAKAQNFSDTEVS